MAPRDIIKPKAPSRQEIIDTIGDQGMNEWRNPVHLEAVKEGWPKRPGSEDGKEQKNQFGMERTITGKKGRVE